MKKVKTGNCFNLVSMVYIELLCRSQKNQRNHEIDSHIPSGQNRRKSSLFECIFDNTALYFECRIKKSTPSDCFFGDSGHWI